MQYVDTDADPSTFDSSTARVAVPPGASVDIALLYWGGDTGASSNGGARCSQIGSTATPPPTRGAADTVRVKVGTGGYLPIQASTFDSVPAGGGGEPFQGRADITTLFAPVQRPAALTTVDVTVADLQTATGTNCSGGWTVLLVYTYPSGADRPSRRTRPTYRRSATSRSSTVSWASDPVRRLVRSR